MKTAPTMTAWYKVYHSSVSIETHLCAHWMQVPLVRQPGSKKMYCVSCKNWMMHEQDAREATSSAAQSGAVSAPAAATPAKSATPQRQPPQQPQPSQQQPAAARSPSPDHSQPLSMQALSTSRSKSDEVSAELGRKLLQGWTMLGEACPNEDCVVR